MLAANLSVNWVRYQQIYFLCKISFAYGETWLHMYNDNSAAFQCPWGFILSVAFKLRQSFTRLKMKVKGALSKNCTFYFCYEAKGPLSISVLHTVILMLYRETGIFLFASSYEPSLDVKTMVQNNTYCHCARLITLRPISKHESCIPYSCYMCWE